MKTVRINNQTLRLYDRVIKDGVSGLLVGLSAAGYGFVDYDYWRRNKKHRVLYEPLEKLRREQC